MRYSELGAWCHVQRHFLSDGAVAQFCPHLTCHHSVQSLVDVVHQCHGRLVISSTDLRTRGKTHSNRLVKEEPGVVHSYVVPSMRVLISANPHSHSPVRSIRRGKSVM